MCPHFHHEKDQMEIIQPCLCNPLNNNKIYFLFCNNTTKSPVLFMQSQYVLLINFQPRDSQANLLFKQRFILKFLGKLAQKKFYLSINLQIIYHCQFLIHGLVFPQISIAVKPQALQRVTSQNFFISQIDMGSIQ